MPKTTTSSQYIFTVGRRRASVATVKLFSGKGPSSINGKDLDKYFPGATFKIGYEKPFAITDSVNKYHYQAKVTGGGKHGQLNAISLALARALKKSDIGFGPLLRQAGLLTVDARVRQRRMVGTGGKARRAKQSPKR